MIRQTVCCYKVEKPGEETTSRGGPSPFAAYDRGMELRKLTDGTCFAPAATTGIASLLLSKAWLGHRKRTPASGRYPGYQAETPSLPLAEENKLPAVIVRASEETAVIVPVDNTAKKIYLWTVITLLSGVRSTDTEIHKAVFVVHTICHIHAGLSRSQGKSNPLRE